MDNVIEVFDAKVTMRSTLHTLASIKELLCKSGNERRNTMFRSTQFGKWLDFSSFANGNHLLNYIFQHQRWFIRSMEYFGSHDVEHEPLLTDHEIPVGENIIVAFERQSEPDVSVERQSKPDLPERSLSDVLNGEFSCDISRPNEHMSEDFVENELESGDGKDNAGFNFDNNENHSLNDMVRTETEDIHLDELLSEK
nr:phospholipase-like protein [Tanacetum cinerariifolium]